jgi:ribulose-bisphosphate carboxylase large chain
LESKKSGQVRIAFPLDNINLKEDSISQLLCHLMGGQMDIDDIEECHLLNIEFPQSVHHQFLGPKYGITGMREFTKVYDKPLLGGIIKPKVVNNVEMLMDITKELVDGGVNFIKEDEIMSNPQACPLEKRIPAVMKYLSGKNVVYSFCINGDAPYVMKRVQMVHDLGGNGVHLNFWSGLGMYRVIREMDLPLFIHFQKSGDKVITEKSHKYHIDWNVVCDLAGMMGVDTIHAGMWGGYMNESEEDVHNTINTLHVRNTLPALSCGFHPGLVDAVTSKFGIDYMANVGGAIHGHPGGTLAGVKAMRQAIDKNYGAEYDAAIKKWGKLS